MPSTNPIVNLIAAGARRRGLDPNAVLSVARVEGLSGGIGDNSTSFGPFQLHYGGAYPSHAPRGAAASQAWAMSPAGIDYALDQIAPVARGLRGRPAVAAIVRRFERPADPTGEIGRAWSLYRSGGGSPVVSPSPPPASTFPRGAPAARTTPPPPASASLPGLSPVAASILAANSEIIGVPAPPVELLTGRRTQSARPTPVPAPARPRLTHTAESPNGTVKIKTGRGPIGQQAAQMVKDYLGTPYVWGGERPGGFDCSGLLQYVWAQKGVKIPRVTYDQWRTGSPVAKATLQPGDAVFFHAGQRGPEHVGMYVGGGKFIEAPRTGLNVRVSTLAGRSDYLGARRFA